MNWDFDNNLIPDKLHPVVRTLDFHLIRTVDNAHRPAVIERARKMGIRLVLMAALPIVHRPVEQLWISNELDTNSH